MPVTVRASTCWWRVSSAHCVCCWKLTNHTSTSSPPTLYVTCGNSSLSLRVVTFLKNEKHSVTSWLLVYCLINIKLCTFKPTMKKTFMGPNLYAVGLCFQVRHARLQHSSYSTFENSELSILIQCVFCIV